MEHFVFCHPDSSLLNNTAVFCSGSGDSAVRIAYVPVVFLLPSSPLPQVAEAAGAGEVIGGSWSSILFSLD
eukprot:COSAG06_NODE_62885_length_263_cov_201.804878_1_plen_70_part_01